MRRVLRPGAGECGYVLLVLLVSSSVLLTALALALPRMAMQSQRLKDERLIERGEQYRRAIELYYRDHGKYPSDLEDLEDTDGVRYLRNRHPDPMGESGEWRLIHMGEDGRFEDSLLFDTQKDDIRQRLGQPGLVITPGTEASQAAPGELPTGPGRGAQFGGEPLGGPDRARTVRESAAPDLAQRSAYSQGFAFSASEGTRGPEEMQEEPEDSAPPGMLDPFSRQGQQLDRESPPGSQPPPFPGGMQAGRRPSASQPRPTPPGGTPGSMAQGSGAAQLINRLLTTPRQGGVGAAGGAAQGLAQAQVFERGVAGVASTSTEIGVKVYNGKKAYNEWEFVYDYRVAGADPGPQQGGAQRPAGARGLPRSGDTGTRGSVR